MYTIDKNFLLSTWFFHKKTLWIKEVLFDEWETDENIYMILKWFLSVEKYTTQEHTSTKQVAILKKGDSLWESALTSDAPKEVRVKAMSSVDLLSINAVQFDEFLEKYPRPAKEMLVHFIFVTNQRVSKSNTYIASIYEINSSIKEMSTINFKEIFIILEKMNAIMNGDFLLFLEVNPVMKTFLSLKYDSRSPGKMQDVIVEKWNYTLEDIWIEGAPKLLTKEITIWKEALWNIIIWRQKAFVENEKRIFLWMINSLAWVLKQKKILEEERDREFAWG